MKYIPGHNPDLVIYEDEVEKERIDLTKIADGKATPEIADIEALLTQKGFTMKPAPPPDSCADKVADCQGWATAGECQANPGYMSEMCPKACGCVSVDRHTTPRRTLLRRSRRPPETAHKEPCATGPARRKRPTRTRCKRRRLLQRHARALLRSCATHQLKPG